MNNKLYLHSGVYDQISTRKTPKQYHLFTGSTGAFLEKHGRVDLCLFLFKLWKLRRLFSSILPEVSIEYLIKKKADAIHTAEEKEIATENGNDRGQILNKLQNSTQ